MPEKTHKIRAITDLNPGDHLCQIYETEEEYRELITAYLVEGLRQNEKVFYIVDAHTRETIEDYLKDAGCSPKPYLDSGQFSFFTHQESYTKEGSFDPDGMISLLRSETEKAVEAGYSALRVTEEMTWALKGLPGSEKLIEYEAKLNNFFPTSKATAICQYDKRRFSPEILLDVLKTHPIVIISSEIIVNPFYVPPEDFFGPNLTGVTLEYWIKNLIGCKKAQAQVQRDKENIELIYNLIPSAIFTVDKNRHITSWNKKAEEISGYPADEILGKECRIFSEYPCSEKCVMYADNGKKPVIGRECTIRKKNGQLLNIIKNADLLSDKEGHIIGGVESFEDITERKRRDEALFVSEQKYRGLIETTTDIIWEMDKNGLYTYISPKIKDVLGYEPYELLDKAPFDIMPLEEAEKISKIFLESTNNKVPFYNLENINRHKDGHLITLETSAIPVFNKEIDFIGYRGISRDVSKRKKAEEELRNSQERLKILFDYAPDAYYLNDLSGKFVDGNKLAEEYSGYKKEELIGKSFLKVKLLSGPQILKSVALLAKNALGLSTGPAEFTLNRKDGSQLTVEIRTFPVKIQGRLLVLGIARDITERKKILEAIRQNEERLRSLIENIEDIILITDENQVITYGSPSVGLVLGYKTENFQGKNLLEFIHPDDRSLSLNAASKALENPGATEFLEHRLRHSDGSWRSCQTIGKSTIDVDGKPVIVVTIRDITGRKEIEEKIKKAAEEWRTTFDSITDFISIHDKDFKITRVNKAFANLFKMRPQEVIGKTCYELWHGRKEMHPSCPHEQVIQNRKPGSAEFFEPRLGMYLEITCSPIFDQRGEIVATVHLAKDITSRKEIEKRARLAQLGELVADMAHEVNNPLMIISGNAQLSLMDRHKEEVENSFRIIFGECQKAKSIIQRLLKFSRPSKGEFKQTDISKTIEAVVNIVEHQFNLVGIEIKRNYLKGIPLVLADEQQMQEVFMNLLNNSKDAMPQGGVIEIAASLEGDYLKIDFKDTGCGMAEEVKNRIFEPFFTTKEKGTGLGLSVCYGIIKTHNGELKFESQPDKGTTASILLPLKEGK